MAIATSAGMTGQVLAQATTSTIFGTAPAAAGETVQIVGGAGFNRTVPVDSTGRYSVTVPVGTYTVNLLQNGNIVQSQANITPKVSGAQAVNFIEAGASAKNAQNLSTVTVTGNALPAIDVTSTREASVITAEQLKHLPVARSGEAIALLAPGTVQGAGMLGNGPTGQPMVSFGGSSVAENAYYINGFNTSDPLGNAGGITLPYGSISQQETLTAGYGAEYGRSAGGVISQIGKSGTNDWHFGGQALWQPAFARANYINTHYVNPRSDIPGQTAGSIYDYRNRDSRWENVYDAYVSGPLIKDKLFFFIAAESDKQQRTNVQSVEAGTVYYRKYSMPKFYGKLDWNINDSNILSLTGVRNKEQYSASIYDYNYAPNNNYSQNSVGAFNSLDQSFKNAFSIWIAKYTSYITDNLTLDAMYGKMRGTYYTVQPAYPGFDPTLAHIIQGGRANPALWPNGKPPQNNNANTNVPSPDHKSSTTNLRLDLDWKLGQHDIKFGIDNMTTIDMGDGSAMSGPGYAWDYDKAPSATVPFVGSDVSQAPFVDATGNYPNGAGGYIVSKYVFVTAAAVKVSQRAQYIEDNWQITPNLLLNLGLRNDQFTNYNPDGVPYVRLTKPQWAPRLGFSWDVFGDSTLKVYGNAGRYYLALPAGVALREASGSTYVQSYYTYSGIDANGVPQGLTPIMSHGLTQGPGVPVSNNNEYGQPLDPNTVRSTNLKAEYQDEFVLGMQQQINPSWVYGVQGTVRKLGRIVDDVADTRTQCAQLLAQNPGLTDTNCSDYALQGSVLINPGSTNQFRISDGHGGYYSYTVSPEQFGFPKASRKYYALEAYLEHPFDGKWQGKIDYVFSKSYGSTEGPVQSNIGQGGSSVSATTQWDYGQLMQYANGVQANSRKHVLKAYGTYQVTPEWTVSGILTVASGTPKSCLGYYGPGETNPGNGYGAFYHWCGGVPTPGGSTGYTPWIHPLDLSVEYRPEWADKKLGFQLQVHNVLNEQKMTQAYEHYGSTAIPNPRYGQPFATETPRYVQFGVTYDY
ncbi:TonB-dependent receptor [Rhodanobacter sp. C06]|uniref:TonB-dependent receptor plug domain-containing protein n=1 Tax=Rhodanobacter sp. C06 TaxID=1945854 RepID=UPI0031B5EACA